MPDVWAGLGGLSGQTAAQEARRNGAAARAKRYADYVLEDRCAKSNGKRNKSCTLGLRAKFGSESGRARSYAQRRFVNMSAFEANMLRRARRDCVILTHAAPSNVNMKTMQIH